MALRPVPMATILMRRTPARPMATTDPPGSPVASSSEPAPGIAPVMAIEAFIPIVAATTDVPPTAIADPLLPLIAEAWQFVADSAAAFMATPAEVSTVAEDSTAVDTAKLSVIQG